jgi:hypothetical protein
MSRLKVRKALMTIIDELIKQGWIAPSDDGDEKRQIKALADVMLQFIDAYGVETWRRVTREMLRSGKDPDFPERCRKMIDNRFNIN